MVTIATYRWWLPPISKKQMPVTPSVISIAKSNTAEGDIEFNLLTFKCWISENLLVTVA